MTTSDVSKWHKLQKFQHWIRTTCSKEPLVYFRMVFAAIWLTYDLLDVSLGQTAKILWLYRSPIQGNSIFLFQILLIVCEIALLFGWRARYFAFCAFLARGAIAYVAPLNDFFYFSMIMLILSQSDCGGRYQDRKDKILSWPRDLLVMQTAWIYFASAFLKLNPPFLSGGDLYARGNYEAKVLPLPFPQLYRNSISHLSFDSVLAWFAVTLEMSLSICLILWLISPKYFPRHRKYFRLVAIGLSVAIHGYAACFLNVFFFSLSMIAQVALLTFEP